MSLLSAANHIDAITEIKGKAMKGLADFRQADGSVAADARNLCW
jgi:hypothetical protein